MNRKFKIFFFLIINFSIINFFAICQENSKSPLLQESDYSLSELLSSYLENDLALQKFFLEVKKSELDLKKTKIENGFDITLSTGNMTFYSSPSSTVINVKPSIKASVKNIKNLSVGVSTDYQVNTTTKVNDFKDTKLNVGLDLLSTEEDLTKIEVLASERLLLESNRKLQEAALSAEKKFYNELIEILNIANQIYTAFQDVYTDKLNLEKLKAQGYSKSSSTYRIAEMKVSTGEHNIEINFHNLKKAVIVFYNRCGINFDSAEQNNFVKFIPKNIPELDALIFTDFDKEKFNLIEKSNWAFFINELLRKSDKFFSLGVNAGYTFHNATTKSDTVDCGVSAIIGGLGLNSGVSFPLFKDSFNPAFTFSATVSPTTFFTKNITNQQNALSKKQDLIDIKTAEHDYDTAAISFEQTVENLNWQKKSVQQNLDLYQKNEQDLFRYFKDGIITESEWRSALNSRQLYEVKLILCKLEFILHNNNVMSQFVDIFENEIKSDLKENQEFLDEK